MGCIYGSRGEAITYDVDFYNESSWVPIASKTTDVSVEYKLPDGLNITNAKIRVRAVDNNTATSALSGEFSLYCAKTIVTC
jgi:hypothetical protein